MRNWIIGGKYLFREFTAYNLVFTVISLSFYIAYGNEALPYIFWIKSIGYSALGLFFYQSRKKYFYFFHNLHLNIRDLVIISLSMDFVLTLLAFFCTYWMLK